MRRFQNFENRTAKNGKPKCVPNHRSLKVCKQLTSLQALPYPCPICRPKTPATRSLSGHGRSDSSLSLDAMRSPLAARPSSQRQTKTPSKGISKTLAALVDSPAASVESFVAPDTPRDGSPQSQQTASMAAAEGGTFQAPFAVMESYEGPVQSAQFDLNQVSEMPVDITKPQACSPSTTSASASRPTTSTDYQDDDSSMGPSRGTTPALHKEGTLGASPFPSRAATPCDSIPDLAPGAPVQDRLWSASILGATPKTAE